MIPIFGNTFRPRMPKKQADAATKPAQPSAPSAARTVASSSAHTAAPGGPISFAGLRRGFKWLQLGRGKKRLQMLETVSLGEKRFVALVKVDGRQFLIGGAPGNVGMLAELAPEETFQQVLRDATQGLETHAAPETTTDAANPTARPEHLAQSNATDTPSTVRPEPNSSPKAMDTIEPLEDAPFSISPTVLARMQPAPAATGKTTAGLRQEPDANAKARKASGSSVTSSTTSLATPIFTFQLSSATPAGSTASPEQTHYRFGAEAARRMASVWKLKEDKA